MILLQMFTQHQSQSPSPHLPTTLQGFIDICIARQNEGTNSHGRLEASRQGPLPSNWASFQNVEHAHLYFGARRFWTDPWDCEPGFEHLCADPITESGSEAYISACLARPQSSLPSKHPLPENPFMRLPREVFDLIISRLSLRDALSLCSINRNLVNRSDKEFWRFQTMRLHGCWLWELRDYPSTSSNVNWRALLQVLETHRFRIQAGAEPYWLSTAASENDRMKRGPRRCAESSLVPIPLGLKNRQRIWRCLESVGSKADWELK